MFVISPIAKSIFRILQQKYIPVLHTENFKHDLVKFSAIAWGVFIEIARTVL
jgi:hypothetical protein